MKLILSTLIFLLEIGISAQTILTTAGQTFTNSEDTWLGVNIPRSVPTAFVFKNNTIKSLNRNGYMLQAGDEGASSFNNNLDNEIITGNKFSWNGTDMTCITHGLFTGHNSDIVVKYNYLDHVPMGIIRKSSINMSNIRGGVAYNIVKGGAVAVVVKGMSNVNIYNNTFYTDRTTSQTWRPLVHIYTNTDNGGYSVAHGTKIFNNIFYTKYQTFAITVDDAESLTGLKCDYNVYWCETGSPRFYVNGSIKTFAQWQALGFDGHSVVINPNFKDLINFVPASRLDVGTNLGPEWENGLAVSAKWGINDPETAIQNGAWQAGAVVYEGPVAPGVQVPAYVNSAINNETPSRLEMAYNISLNNIIPVSTAFVVKVNGSNKPVNSVDISGNKVILALNATLSYGDIVTVSYIRPAQNPLQSVSGGIAEAILDKSVTNKITGFTTPSSGTSDNKEGISVYPNPAREYINIENTETSLVPLIVRIFDFSGKLCMETPLNSGNSNKIQINLKSGIYIVKIETGSMVRFNQKLIIVD